MYAVSVFSFRSTFKTGRHTSNEQQRNGLKSFTPLFQHFNGMLT